MIRINKKLSLILPMLIFLSGCKEEVTFTPSEKYEESITFKVDIKGAIMFPGIYDINENLLLIDLVNLAGGFREDADISNINLASTLEPNQMIIIPSKEKEESSLININKATKEELMKLPGIGESKAKKIIEYRENNGKFISIEELKKISGISEEVYNQIKELVRI